MFIFETERCGFPVTRGPCQNWIHKWYYDSILHECKIYTSGICKSENMFDSEAECLYYCVGGKSKIYIFFNEHKCN